MNYEKCAVCEHMGRLRVGDHLDLIFQTGNRQKVIPLCWSHSVELFKLGQTQFLIKFDGALDHLNLDPQMVYNSFKLNEGFHGR
jgi:hypothetical protein